VGGSSLLAHKGLALKVLQSVVRVPRALKFDEAKASHDAAVDDTAKAIKKLRYIVLARVWGKPTEIQTACHDVVNCG
jgi:hypothetical protein